MEQIRNFEEREEIEFDGKRVRSWHEDIKKTDNKRLDEKFNEYIEVLRNKNGFVFSDQERLIKEYTEWLKKQD